MLAHREHHGELRLRRHFVGEAPDEAITAHLETCEVCRARVSALVEEERDFQARIPVDRFVAGIEAKLEARKVRQASPTPRVLQRWVAPLSAVAAAAAVIVAIGLPPTERDTPRPGYHGLKGSGAVVDLYVGGVGGSRVAASREPLRDGERVRIAYRPGPWAYLAVVSVDEDGVVSSIYPEAGESLPVGGEAGETRMLPDSIAFDGRGLERIVTVFSPDPLAEGVIADAATAAFDRAGGDLEQMGDLDLPGEQFHRIVIKP